MKDTLEEYRRSDKFEDPLFILKSEFDKEK